MQNNSQASGVARYVLYFFGIFILCVAAVNILELYFKFKVQGASAWMPMLAAAWVAERYLRDHGELPSGSTKWRLILESLTICLIVSLVSLLFFTLFNGGLQKTFAQFGAPVFSQQRAIGAMAVGLALISIAQFFGLWLGYGLVAGLVMKMRRRAE